MRYIHVLRALVTLPFLLWASAASVRGAPVDVERVIAELEPQTDLPIWVPDEVPGMDELYVNFYVQPDLYSIYFDYTADCGGSTVCNYGSFMAERNGEFITLEDLGNPSPPSQLPSPEVVPIRFENGMSGQFVNACGAYCTARVQWRLGGILYSAVIKNGTQEATVELANIILQGEERVPGDV